MRIGKDLIIFTKKQATQTILLLSQTFLEKEGLDGVKPATVSIHF